MINYFDTDHNNESSLMSTNLRTNSLFRTRAISQDRQERKISTNEEIIKTTVTAPKSYRKMSRLGEYNALDKKFEQPAKHTFDHTGFEKFG